MKHLLVIPILCTIAISNLQAQHESELLDLTRRFMVAYNQQDWTSLQKMYTKDAIRTDIQGNEARGADMIMQIFDEMADRNKAILLLMQTGSMWSDAEKVLIAKGTYEYYGISKADGKEFSYEGRYENTLSKDKSGEWKIAKSVLSPISDNKAIINDLYQSFANGDIPAALATMADGIVWNEAENFPYADRNPYVGPDAVLTGVFARIGEDWEYWNLTDIHLNEVSDNKVLSTLRYKAKHKKTGKVIDSQTAHLFTLKDGKIVAFQQYTDTKQAVDAIH
jgi:ketosteroid isomerase-like protein